MILATMKLLEAVGVANQAGKYPHELSGGQQQRVAIARALANDPELLAADEPAGNLDTGSYRAVLDLLESQWRKGRTMVLVTHDPAVVSRAHRTIILTDGRTVSDSVATGGVGESAWSAISGGPVSDDERTGADR